MLMSQIYNIMEADFSAYFFIFQVIYVVFFLIYKYRCGCLCMRNCLDIAVHKHVFHKRILIRLNIAELQIQCKITLFVKGVSCL